MAVHCTFGRSHINGRSVLAEQLSTWQPSTEKSIVEVARSLQVVAIATAAVVVGRRRLGRFGFGGNWMNNYNYSNVVKSSRVKSSTRFVQFNCQDHWETWKLKSAAECWTGCFEWPPSNSSRWMSRTEHPNTEPRESDNTNEFEWSQADGQRQCVVWSQACPGWSSSIMSKNGWMGEY